MIRRSLAYPCRRTSGAAGVRERGSASIQLVILMPALFALMFLGVQAALMYQGRTIVLAAAQEGARVAAAEHGTAAGGITTARAFVASTSAGMTNVTAQASRSAVDVRVTVSAHTVSVIPGWNPLISQSASMPVEKVTG